MINKVIDRRRNAKYNPKDGFICKSLCFNFNFFATAWACMSCRWENAVSFSPFPLRELSLRFAPPILSFRLLPEKKECAAPGVRKKRAAETRITFALS